MEKDVRPYPSCVPLQRSRNDPKAPATPPSRTIWQGVREKLGPGRKKETLSQEDEEKVKEAEPSATSIDARISPIPSADRRKR